MLESGIDPATVRFEVGKKMTTVNIVYFYGKIGPNFPQIDRWWFLFFPNDLRCGFRKLKERGVGNRTSGAGLVPKSLLLLLLYLICPRSRPRPDFTYKEFQISKSAWYGFA